MHVKHSFNQIKSECVSLYVCGDLQVRVCVCGIFSILKESTNKFTVFLCILSNTACVLWVIASHLIIAEKIIIQIDICRIDIVI